jgi:hypothetical protein
MAFQHKYLKNTCDTFFSYTRTTVIVGDLVGYIKFEMSPQDGFNSREINYY